MFDKINLFLETLIPKKEQRINLLNILSYFLSGRRQHSKIYIMNNNKLLVELLKLSFGDYYCYLPFDCKCIDYDEFKNVVKGKRLALIEQKDEEKQMSIGYMHEISHADFIYKEYKKYPDKVRLQFTAILLCKDCEKYIDKFSQCDRAMQIIKLDFADDKLELLKKNNLEELSSEFMNLLKIYNYNQLKNNN